ncbi:MAG: hypothetical protein JHC54_05550 [Acinetobacter sp.]|nr:hypothetical protein [Acinetobacter sp.]
MFCGQDNREIIAQQFSKGVAGDLLYQETFSSEISGEAIKEALTKIQSKCISKVSMNTAACTVALSKCTGYTPTKLVDNYRLEYCGPEVVDSLPKIFSYDEMCETDKSNLIGGNINESSNDRCKSEYNQSVYELCHSLCDLAEVNAILRNIDLKKKYKLSAKQCLMLGV